MRQMLRTLLAVTVLTASPSLTVQRSADRVIDVYKLPTCGCCAKWAEHLRARGLTVRTTNVNSIAELPSSRRLSRQPQPCHVGVIGDYVVEGHVPASDVLRLLKERPAIAGLSVPGMPVGSPGMEVAGQSAQPYDVLAVDRQGNARVYASHGR